MKKYKSCKVCNCENCREGLYRIDSWYCPLYKKQICDICCFEDNQYINKLKCMSLKCKYYGGI